MKVYISPSTQEKNMTALGTTEEYMMHLIADELVQLLQDSGLMVYRGKKEQTLQQMVAESNRLKVDAHIAIHSNATGTNEKARGCEVFHYPSSTKGIKLANYIYEYIEALTPTADRGVKTSNVYYELVYTNAPAVIIEVDFHDNHEGAKWIMDNIYLIAEAIAQGICDYFNIHLKKNPYKEAIEQIKAILEGLP